MHQFTVDQAMLDFICLTIMDLSGSVPGWTRNLVGSQLQVTDDAKSDASYEKPDAPNGRILDPDGRSHLILLCLRFWWKHGHPSTTKGEDNTFSELWDPSQVSQMRLKCKQWTSQDEILEDAG